MREGCRSTFRGGNGGGGCSGSGLLYFEDIFSRGGKGGGGGDWERGLSSDCWRMVLLEPIVDTLKVDPLLSTWWVNRWVKINFFN